MTTAQVEKVTKDNREFVSVPTDMATAYAILTAIVIGFSEAGYRRVDEYIYHKLPKNCMVLAKGNETVGFRVVTHEQ